MYKVAAMHVIAMHLCPSGTAVLCSRRAKEGGVCQCLGWRPGSHLQESSQEALLVRAIHG